MNRHYLLMVQKNSCVGSCSAVCIREAHSTNAPLVRALVRAWLKGVAALPVAMSSLRFVIFLGTVRDGNFGQRAAKFMVKKLEARGHQTTLLGKGSVGSPSCYIHNTSLHTSPSLLRS